MPSNIELPRTLNAGRRNRLGENGHVGSVGLERDEDVSRLNAVFFSELGDDGVGQEGRVVRSQRGVGSHDNALRFAKVEKLLLVARAKTETKGVS